MIWPLKSRLKEPPMVSIVVEWHQGGNSGVGDIENIPNIEPREEQRLAINISISKTKEKQIPWPNIFIQGPQPMPVLLVFKPQI